MKARTLILTAGAALAVAGPAAQAMPLYPEGDGPAVSSYSGRTLQAARPDRTGPLGIGGTTVDVVTSSPSGGFDRHDAGIGIGAASGLAALLLGGSLLFTGRRRSASALG